MIAGRCKTCDWWDSQHARVKVAPAFEGIETPGICRKHKPGAEHIAKGYYIGVQPIMDAEDVCGEYREKKG